jgi:single-strand DNA-binding protein
MSQNINVVVITGNLTRDPELRHTGGGTAVSELRVAVNGRRKNGQTGEWEDKANYLDVTVFGSRAVAVCDCLSKGSPVAVDGRLDWQEWEAKDGSGHRQTVKIIANQVQFLGKPKDTDEEAGATDSHEEDRQPVAVGAGSEEEDIPF